MMQNAPRLGVELDREMLAEVLSLDAGGFNAGWSIQVVSIDLPAVIIPLRDRGALIWNKVFTPAYRPFFDDVSVENLFLFCPDLHDDASDFTTRIYVPGRDVTEDPTTGSADGCSVGYLACHYCFEDDEVEVTVEQGCEMG